METKDINVSIIIPTLNEEKNIEDTLQRIVNQEKEFIHNNIKYVVAPHIIVVDSGSTDNTINIIKKFSKNFPWIEVYLVPRFHHSITRNFGAKKSKGDILVFLNADAKPVDAVWLINLIAPLIKSYAASFSRQIAPKGLISVDSLLASTGFPPNSATIDKHNFNKYFSRYGVLLSSVSCGIKRRIFFEIGGFNKYVPINEDQELAFRLLKSGYKIFYAANSRVFHAHRDGFIATPRRYYRYGAGWKIIQRIHRDFRQEYSMDTFKSVLKALFTESTNGTYRMAMSLKRLKTFIYGAIAFFSALIGRYL